MALNAPEVIIEQIFNEGFADIVTNASSYMPLIFSQFPTQYQTDAIEYLTNSFKLHVNFNYEYNPADLPAFNIVLSTEGEAQQYLNDGVEYADQNPNTIDYEEYGSDWQVTITVFIRCEKQRQTIILYNLAKWLLLKNRETLEANYIRASVFSGSDLYFETDKKPTFVYTRSLKIVCRVLNTVEYNITSDPTIQQVVSVLDQTVRILPNQQSTGDSY